MRWAPAALSILLAGAAGCQAGPGSPASGPRLSDGLIDPPGQIPEGSRCTAAQDQPATRFVRLTHRQYDNSVRDLTGLDLALGRDFLPDQAQAGFNRGSDLQVGDLLGQSYRLAAEQVAAAVVSSVDAYRLVVGCDPATAGGACARSFIATFGRKVFRRPLSDAEVAARVALFQQAPLLMDGGDPFERGVQITLEAFFQSPYFLYRVERSHQADVSGLVPLDSHEIAVRLSYGLTDTIPDPILAAAADAGALGSPQAVAAQARRLLALPAARETVRDFHHQWLDLDLYPQKLAKAPQLYPSVSPALAPVLTREVESFVEDVTFDLGRGLPSLLTAPFTYVNRVTAPIYGLDGDAFGDDLRRVDLDPSRRAGLLTQIGFLATRAFSDLSSPIHRGVFIQRRLLCTALPNPPPGIPALPPVDGTLLKTTRQQVEAHTAPPACAGCHQSVINPPGFGLENYDAIGQYRDSENGVPIQASGQLVATAGLAPFSNGVELAAAIAAAPESSRCYATNWLRYLSGRSETAADDCALAVLAARLSHDEYTATDLLVDMTRTRAFMFRAPEAHR